MKAGVGAPFILMVPYAMYIYFRLDVAPGSLSSFCALLIAFGFLGWILGSAIGTLNAKALLHFGPPGWFEHTESLPRAATIGSCACFAVLSLGLITGQSLLILLSPATPAIAAAACLRLNQQSYERSTT